MTIIMEEKIVKTIHLTGLNTYELVDAIENQKFFVRCFICKRQEGEESIGFIQDSKPVKAAIEILNYEKLCKDVVYTWSICTECAWLFDLLL